MYISKVKIFFLFLIIVSVLYKSNIESKIIDDINTYSLRRHLYNNQELPSFPNDYVSEEYTKLYLQYFLNILQNNINADISKYVEESYYKDKIENSKEIFNKNMKENIIIVNPTSNYQNCEYITMFVNKDGYKTFVFGVMVMEKGLDYPRGFSSLKERNDKDKSKMMDIHVIEYSPYNFKIIFPDKTILVEDF
ncbi:MAG: hypothetical protein PHD15_01160 [Clostridia bacterium]|nr:hypothetical protein [Clostridia bacterium]MDD4386358.1 hypothetical protein [Clostridia bacterium]